MPKLTAAMVERSIDCLDEIDKEFRERLRPPSISFMSTEFQHVKQSLQLALLELLGPGKRPSIEEVRAYCAERGKGIDADAWYDHYSSNGWMVGKVKMKDWKAAVRTWERNRGKFGVAPSATPLQRLRDGN